MSFDVETKTDGVNERVITVRRVSKTTKGGRTMSFSVLVVVGDGKGRVGIAYGKAAEVPTAIQKALEAARKNMFFVQLNGDTLYHAVTHKRRGNKVIILPASEGTGIIAGAAMRAVFEVLGVKNVLSKVVGSSNPINVVQATLEALAKMKSPKSIANKRGLSVKEIFTADEG